MTSVAVRKRAPPKGGGLGLCLAMIPQEQTSAPSSSDNRLCKHYPKSGVTAPGRGHRDGAPPSRADAFGSQLVPAEPSRQQPRSDHRDDPLVRALPRLDKCSTLSITTNEPTARARTIHEYHSCRCCRRHFHKSKPVRSSARWPGEHGICPDCRPSHQHTRG